MKELTENLKILDFCETHFMKHGFQRTTMDDIAKELRISKKTIYKHFNTKIELVRAVFVRIRNDLAGQIEAIVNGEGNVIIKLYQISKLFSTRVAAISNSWLNDLRYNAPDIWQEVEEFRLKMMQKNLVMLIKQGKSEGFIEDYPDAIILGVIVSSVQGIITPEFILNNNLSFQKAGTLTLDLVFNGIVTKKGRKLFRQYKSGEV